MLDFLLGFAFVFMVVAPAIAASIQSRKSHDHEG